MSSSKLPDAPLVDKKSEMKLEAVTMVNSAGFELSQEDKDLLTVAIYQPENLTVYEYISAAAKNSQVNWNIALTLARNAISYKAGAIPYSSSTHMSFSAGPSRNNSRPSSRSVSRPTSPTLQQVLEKSGKENTDNPAVVAATLQQGHAPWIGHTGATKDHFNEIFKRNRAWAAQKLREDPTYFETLASGQKPQFLWIGCSDARVPANEITGLPPGDVFVHRNVANLVVNTDTNILAVLQFAIEYLNVPDIIVCGHYGCGGVKASLKEHDHGLIEHWICNIRDVQRLYQDELSQIEDEKARGDRLVELNVVEQCVNLLKNPIVQRSQIKYGYPRVHAMVYDVHDGLLRELDADLMGYVERHKEIYSLFDFTQRRKSTAPKS